MKRIAYALRFERLTGADLLTARHLKGEEIIPCYFVLNVHRMVPSFAADYLVYLVSVSF